MLSLSFDPLGSDAFAAEVEAQSTRDHTPRRAGRAVKPEATPRTSIFGAGNRVAALALLNFN
jgi:hypothetical protein